MGSKTLTVGELGASRPTLPPIARLPLGCQDDRGLTDRVLLLASRRRRWRGCRSFLLDLGFGLIGRLLLVLQSFLRHLIGRRGGDIRFLDIGVWRLWSTACT